MLPAVRELAAIFDGDDDANGGQEDRAETEDYIRCSVLRQLGHGADDVKVPLVILRCLPIVPSCKHNYAKHIGQGTMNDISWRTCCSP